MPVLFLLKKNDISFLFLSTWVLQQFTSVVLRELSAGGGNSAGTSIQQRQSNASPQSGVVVELAEAKAKIRRWRQELEEKCEQVAELRDELDAIKNQSAKIKQENMDLVQVILFNWLLSSQNGSVNEFDLISVGG